MDRKFNENFLGAGDPGVLDGMYRRFLDDPHSVPRDLARAFAQLGEREGGNPDIARAALAESWQRDGHLVANLNPLSDETIPWPQSLEAETYGLDETELSRVQTAYGYYIGWEFSHVPDAQQRDWLAAQAMTPTLLSEDEQRTNLVLLTKARLFEDTLFRRLPGVKTFGLAGSETFLVAIEGVLTESVGLGIGEVVVGGMHRGRLTQLALAFGKPLPELLAMTMGVASIPDGLDFASDVPYHLGWSGSREIAGKRVPITVSPHPSHLSVVASVSLGKARGKQSLMGASGTKVVLPLMLHTDAAFSGQGIIAETFQLSNLTPFTVGGTVHLVLNNQLGFTTVPEDGRSSRYCTDVAKATGTPILHVNGDQPDAVMLAAKVAARYRARFGADIVIDVIGYRRRGHNELDDPRTTQPAMYANIDACAGIDETYARSTGLDCTDEATQFRTELDAGFDAATRSTPDQPNSFAGVWSGLRHGEEAEMTLAVDTGVNRDHLQAIGHQITAVPESFTPSPKVKQFLDARQESIDTGQFINWATAEILALSSLLAEGQSVRLGGQDAARGPFAQRHLILHDQVNGQRHEVLDPLAKSADTAVEVFNTPLTEYAVLAFEYGLSLSDPNRLTLWEAQFGDFFNVAQAVFDQFIVCGEDRWLRSSGLTILLPHGLDGGGPDHSTAHPERLLAAAAKGNIQVTIPTSPANYFHLLRRQMVRDFRKPLVVLSPKLLLRHRECVSSLEDFEPGTGFKSVIPDDGVTEARRVILCAGKIYYDLKKEREAQGLTESVALIRLEQLYPFPEDDLRNALAPHATSEIVWAQEEPENLGFFLWLDRRIEGVAGRAARLVARPAAATPAVGIKAWHEREKAQVIEAALNLKN